MRRAAAAALCRYFANLAALLLATGLPSLLAWLYLRQAGAWLLLLVPPATALILLPHNLPLLWRGAADALLNRVDSVETQALQLIPDWDNSLHHGHSCLGERKYRLRTLQGVCLLCGPVAGLRRALPCPVRITFLRRSRLLVSCELTQTREHHRKGDDQHAEHPA